MLIGGLQKSTLIDYPGKLACAVFLIGCNFRCPWCYSPELVLPEKIKKQPKISEREFFGFLKERKGLLEGVCVTGGEPTLNKELPTFIKKIKKMGFLVKLDTNGSNPAMLKELIDKELIDYVAMDIKAPLKNQKSKSPIGPSPRAIGKNQKYKSKIKNKYEEAVGAKINLENIKENISILRKNKVDYEFRTTVVPGVHTKEDIIQIAEWISGPKVKYYLQNFRPEKTIDPKFEKVKPYSEEFLLEIQKATAPFFEICQVR